MNKTQQTKLTQLINLLDKKNNYRFMGYMEDDSKTFVSGICAIRFIDENENFEDLYDKIKYAPENLDELINPILDNDPYPIHPTPFKDLFKGHVKENNYFRFNSINKNGIDFGAIDNKGNILSNLSYGYNTEVFKNIDIVFNAKLLNKIIEVLTCFDDRSVSSKRIDFYHTGNAIKPAIFANHRIMIMIAPVRYSK